ncbi:MAG: adenylyl-sulfate kinase [Cryomorphaceae bacterium]|nr:adenylyl-sulfate kinase [Cryomorphaceae bacterium]
MASDPNIIPHDHQITRDMRNKRHGHTSKVIWFTGLSGSGKSTLASALEVVLHEKGVHTYILDGDNIRSGLNKDLDFSEQGRRENIRRIGEVANLFIDAGVVVLSAFISPFEEDRRKVREIVGENNFIEIFVDCPLDICEQRDVKGLYKKARAGLIKNFTGIDSPFEQPKHPDIHVNTHTHSIAQCLETLVQNINLQLNSTTQSINI